jgi:hypothetical protein
MNSYLSALTTSLACYILMAAVYYGWGSILVRMLSLEEDRGYVGFPRMWIGWCFTLLVLQIGNFFVPINSYFSGALFLIGAALCVDSLVRTSPRTLPGVRIAAFAAVLIFFAVWIASWSMLQPLMYDSGLYHFNAIRWLNEYPLVPGLGNLHGRLAFNQSFFAYAASVNFYPLFPHGYSVANSFLLLLVLAECLYALFVSLPKGIINEAGFPARFFLPLCMLPVLIFITVTSSLSSPAPDTAAEVISLALTYYLARHIDQRRSEAALSFLPVILLLSATAITIKLSLLVYASAISVVSILATRCELLRQWKISDLRKKIVYLLPGIMLAVWILKGIVLSGYPLYPVPIGRIPVDWAVPVEQAASDLSWVKSWARLPGVAPDQVLGSWDWMGPWLESIGKHTITVVYPVVIAIIATLIGALLWFITPPTKRSGFSESESWSLAVPILLGLIYWFFTAPDPRFASALFFLLPMTMAYPLLYLAKPRKKFAKLALMLFLFFSIHAMLLDWLVDQSSIITSFPSQGYEQVAVAPLLLKKTASGLILWVPATGDQCWDSPLPCTPYPNDLLRRRGNGIRSGFTIIDQPS